MKLHEDIADLLTHTTASDETCSVVVRVEQAVERNLEAIVNTDHDCLSPDLGGWADERSGVEVITGVEVRGDARETKVELLGYYLTQTTPRTDQS